VSYDINSLRGYIDAAKGNNLSHLVSLAVPDQPYNEIVIADTSSLNLGGSAMAKALAQAFPDARFIINKEKNGATKIEGYFVKASNQ
jgi:hypothetical protein